MEEQSESSLAQALRAEVYEGLGHGTEVSIVLGRHVQVDVRLDLERWQRIRDALLFVAMHNA